MADHLKYDSSTGHLLHNTPGHLTYTCDESSSSSSSFGLSSSSSTELHERYAQCLISSSSSSEGNSESSSSGGFTSESSSSSQENHGYVLCESSSSSSDGNSESSSTSEGISSSSQSDSSSSGGYSESSTSESDSSTSDSSSSDDYSESSSSVSESSSSEVVDSSSSSTDPGVLECPDCSGNTNPRVHVTITGINASNRTGTASGVDYFTFLGCDFTNGVTQAVCTSRYSYDTYNTFTYNEWWRAPSSAGTDFLYLRATVSQTDQVGRARVGAGIAGWSSYGQWSRNKFTDTREFFQRSTSNLSTYNINPTTFDVTSDPGDVPDELFGQMTCDNGLTVKWERGSGSWGGP